MGGLRTLVWMILLSSVPALAKSTPGAKHEFQTHRRVRRHIFNSESNQVVHSSHRWGGSAKSQHHLERLVLVLEDLVSGQNVTLDLSLNTDLIPDSYFEKHHHEGKTLTKKFSSAKEVELCHYNGLVRGRVHSWVALSTCDGIHGVVFDGRHFHHIEPENEEYHLLYQQNDHLSSLQSSNFTSRTKRSVSNEKGSGYLSDQNNLHPPETDHKSDIEAVLGPWNANKRSRYVELVLVVDKREFQDHNEDLQKVQRICKDIANVMNGLYSPLNIYIALVGVIVWTEYDEIKLSTNGDQTLTNFLHYRKERLVKEHPNDNAQLLTGITFDGGVVGKALKGPMCTYEFSGGVNMWHSDVIGLVATTVAHEMGHNFGMEHDRDYCVCPDDRCIMAPASSTLKPSFWSSCSLEYLALAFEQGMDYCLRNRPVKLFESPVCGNGFVEQGEECDCGLKNHCDNPCCNPESCTLYANATCATGECCDFKTCRPKPSGDLCRPSDHACDLPEFCTGESEFCPNDVYKVDGTPCKVGHAFCYQGTCRTHSDQCKLLWGPSGKKSEDECYEQNLKGSRHGNCGYNRINESYIQCSLEDVRCGMLHCSHLNERLEFGMESAAILSHSFINSRGRIIPCRTALVDLGLNDIDPGMVPEGSKCGDGKLCVNQRCIPVESLVIGPKSCPRDCSGNGICNSKGHCHCNIGYEPPLCDAPGPGGSIDSGPASSSDEWSPLVFILVACLTLLPLLCLFCCFVAWRAKGVSSSPREWKLFFDEKARSSVDAGPSKKKYHSKLEISGPLENSGLGSPTPSHALLPHVDTSTSALSSLPTTVKESSDSEDAVKFKQESSSRIFGLSRPKFGRQCSASRVEGEKLTFMQSLARSITFPTSIKSREASAKYEIKVEHQQPNSDSSTPIESVEEKEDVKIVMEKELEPPSGESPLVITQSKPPPPPRPNIFVPTSNSKLAFPHSSTFTSGLVSRSPFLTASSSFSTPSALSDASMPSKKLQHSLRYSPKPASLNELASDSSPAEIAVEHKVTTPSSQSAGISSASGQTALQPSKSSVAGSAQPSSLNKKTTTVLAPSRSASGTTTLLTSKPLQSPFFKKAASSSPSVVVTASVTSAITTKPTTSTSVSPSSQFSTFQPLSTSKESSEPSEVVQAHGTHMTKNSTLPTSLSSIYGAHMNMPKSSTLPSGSTPGGLRPEIGKPVLQTATSSAQSLISRAPSTGISQSSILAKTDRRDRSSKGVVFCDPITLPSPTNPNNPPIIHQPTMTSSMIVLMSSPRPSPTVASAPKNQMSIITPTWTTEPTPLTSDAVICHIDESEPDGETTTTLGATSSAPIASPDREVSSPSPSGSSSLAKIKSKLSHGTKKPDPDASSDSSIRSNLRGLEISGPILQSTMDLKTKLVPICGTENTPISRSSPIQTLSPTPKRAAPPPPIQPRGQFKGSHNDSNLKETAVSNSPKPSAVSRSSSSASSIGKRPASIATSRPTRPSAPPPMPPPSRTQVPARTQVSASASAQKPASHLNDGGPSREDNTKQEHIYEKIKGSTPDKEMPKAKKESTPRPSSIGLKGSEVASPQDSEYGTPSSSPLFAKKSPDTVSMASSEGDLMKEILKEIVTKDDEIYSTLTRKKKKSVPKP
ncbi:hypothetical protein TCAL_03011 [Tigriopus californicus]|uniref:Peptidase M12B domain-containing protein n=1 Tax=Tigriopus californicus TaxID=6832 RepID=A0A553NSA3_TIGCA|nr:uncharacterized protein LOC131886053 [Tigriopus californicus]TRY68307.1 hypothetical protein TCAL_03011 [Tigriopus californicus]|eukprot:TCALIF_03011-PA protein Name:"Similar to Adam12 Disintegrin and metalloproteinase domain-containing protein 12 (Mus musculus)" AED:0.01 eAED:0.01 QI:410/1/1/1/1/1/2/507/1629